MKMEMALSLIAVIWDHMLKWFYATNISLQNVGISLVQSVQLYDSLCSFLESACNDFDKFEGEASLRNIYKKESYHLRGVNEEKNLKVPCDKYQKSVLYSMLNRLLVEIIWQMKKYKVLQHCFDFLNSWSQMSDTDLHQAASSLHATYYSDFEDLGDKIVQMKHLMKNENLATEPSTLFAWLLSF
jgi:hypothetical protein